MGNSIIFVGKSWMNKITHDVLDCCYRSVCSKDDILIFLKITVGQYNDAVDKLVLLRYVTRSIEEIIITPAGRLYMETMNGLK